MKKAATLNTFTGGLNMDYNPMKAPKTVLTNALNATIITRNGNEMILLNDMGNGRVETAFLPEGFIPIGTVSFGGIIYIASYNPLTDRSQIGSFPSPERNITSDEINECGNVVTNESFIKEDAEYTNSCDSTDTSLKKFNTIQSRQIKLKILSSEDGDLYFLNPGDRYKVFVLDGSMLEDNAQLISDIYYNDANVVDATPRYLTINIVALSSEGNVIRLDSNLKWDWDLNVLDPKYGYYISGSYSKHADGTIDLDDYRSLVSSAYNVFNSKQSGELALLFELKTINSLSITWDANVYDNQDLAAAIPLPLNADDSPDDDAEYRWANIIFYINYQSDDPRINAKYVIFTGSGLLVDGSVDQEHLEYNGCPFGTVFSLGTFDAGTKDAIDPTADNYRLNDGTDEDIKIITAPFQYDISKMSDTIWNYEITPAMPFGNMDWLAIRGSINFKLLGSGVIELIQWRYYVSATTLTLAWGLEAYPEKNKLIFGVRMEFYLSSDLGKATITWEDKDDNTKSIASSTLPDPIDIYDVPEKKSYSGYFQDLFVFDDRDIERDKLYLVRIIVRYGRSDGSEEQELRTYYRWLYTTGQWNNLYLVANTEDDDYYEDFKEIPLNKTINFDVNYNVTDNINYLQDINSTPVTIPSINDEKGYNEYSMLGANITTVNYIYGDDASSSKFDTEASEAFSVDISFVANYSLFSLTPNKSETKLRNGSVTSTGKVERMGSSTSYEVVESITMDLIEVEDGEIKGTPDGVEALIYDLSKGFAITDKGTNEIAIDSFNALINSDNAHFDVKVQGVIFSKINADLGLKTCHTLHVLKPMLCSSDDFDDLNLLDISSESYKNEDEHQLTSMDDNLALNTGSMRFLYFYRFWAHDNGSGHRTVLKILEYDDSEAGADRIHSNELTVEGPRGDDWSITTWGDSSEYNTYIEPELTKLSGPLQTVLYSTDGKLTVYGTNDADKASGLSRYVCYIKEGAYGPYLASAGANESPSTEMMGLWAKNESNEEILPLNLFSHLANGTGDRHSSNTNYLAGLVSSIYNSIYFIKNVGDLVLELYRAININYLGAIYYETWTINVQTSSYIENNSVLVDGTDLNTLKENYITFLNALLEFGDSGFQKDIEGNAILGSFDDGDNKDAGYNNITYVDGEELTLGFDPKSLQHEFKLTNSDIYNEYDEQRSTSIAYAVYPDNENTVYSLSSSLSIDESKPYVRMEDRTFAQLSSSTAYRVFLTKELWCEKEGVVSNRIICKSIDDKAHKGEGISMEYASNGAKAMISSIKLSNGDYLFGGSTVSGNGKMYFLMRSGDSNTCKMGGCPTFNFGYNYFNNSGMFTNDVLFNKSDVNDPD